MLSRVHFEPVNTKESPFLVMDDKDLDFEQKLPVWRERRGVTCTWTCWKYTKKGSKPWVLPTHGCCYTGVITVMKLTCFEPIVLFMSESRHDTVHVFVLLLLFFTQFLYQILTSLPLFLSLALGLQRINDKNFV